jgi:hypothetical protein
MPLKSSYSGSISNTKEEDNEQCQTMCHFD